MNVDIALRLGLLRVLQKVLLKKNCSFNAFRSLRPFFKKKIALPMPFKTSVSEIDNDDVYSSLKKHLQTKKLLNLGCFVHRLTVLENLQNL